MRLRHVPLVGVLGLLGFITSCGTSPSTSTKSPTDTPSKHKSGPSFDPDAPTLVIALDASESMLESDPGRFSVEGARLAGALVDSGANVGVLSFNRRSKAWFPLQTIRGSADRERLEKAVGGIPFRGMTDFRNALAAAYDMLVKRGAKRGSAVLFLTDGRPDLGSDEASRKNLEAARAALAPFKKSGFRIFTIGLGPDVNAELLGHMSAETGAPPTWLIGGTETGSARGEAKKLLSAFLQVTGDVSRYLEFDEGLAPVEIFPGTRKLVYVLVRDDPETGFGLVKREGVEVPGSSYYRYPRSDSTDSRFQVVFVERPEEGIWHAEVHGDPDIGAILEDIALDLTLVAPKKDGVFIGQPIALGLDVAYTHPGWKAILEERARATVTLVSAETSRVIAKDIPLLRGDVGSGRARFRGSPAARMSRVGGPERVFANVKFTLTRRTKGESSRTFSTAVTVKPRPDAKLLASPEVLDWGSRWVDDAGAEQTLAVTNPTGAPVRVTVEDARSCEVGPSTFELAPGASRDLAVRLKTGIASGALEDRITLRAAPMGPEARTWTVHVNVRGTFYELCAPEVVDLGGAAIDPESAREVALDVPVEIRPPTPGLVRLACGPLAGPSRLSARVETAGTKSRLLVPLKPDTPKGVYETTLKITSKAAGLRPRTIPAKVEVWAQAEADVTAPDVVEVTTLGAKEVEVSMAFLLKYPASGAALEIVKAELAREGGGPALLPDDYELVPEDGWNGKTLEADVRRSMTARIYVSSDVRNGSYRGELKILLKVPGRADGHAVIPIVLKVSR